MHKFFSKITICIFLLFSLFSNISLANENVKLTIKSSDKYTRIIFNNNLDNKYIFKDNILTIKFDKKISIDTKSLIKDNKKLSKAVISNSKDLIMTFKSDSDYQIRKFISDRFSGIDVIYKEKQLPKKQLKIEKPTSIIPIEPDPIAIQQTTNQHEKNSVDYDANSETNSEKLFFNWNEKVASSVFYRNNNLWIIFNKKNIIDTAKIQSFFPKFKYIRQIDDDNNTIIIITLENPVIIKCLRDNYNWIIEFTDNHIPIINQITEYKTDQTKGSFFPAENIIDKAINVTDPIFGDQLSIIAFYDPGYGVNQMQHYMDYIILPSLQGFVVNSLSDNVRVNVIAPGIEITSENTKNQLNKYNPDQVSLLPFSKWKNTNNILSEKELILRNIRDANPADKDNGRLNLARFYLAIGFTRESLAILSLIKSDIKNSDEFLLIKAIAEFILDKNEESEKTFSKLKKLIDYDEVKFWQNANCIKLNKKADLQYLNYIDKFISTYPDNLKYGFAFLDIENNLNNPIYIRNIIKYLSKQDLKNSDLNSYKYYQGILYSIENKIDDAINIWEPVTKDIDDRKNRALASFATIKLLYQNNKININEAIDKLNKITNIWRGDNIEFNILNYLADLYYKNINYIDTLRIWRKLVSNFSYSNDSLYITAKMAKLFTEIFQSESIDNNMSDFQAVSLFYEFRELTPIGQVGDNIIQHLAYKLVKLDLLEKAEELLEHQIKYRLESEKKDMVAVNLAFIYLLDKKPDNALAVISDIKTDTKEEYNRIKLIKAKAYIDLGKYDDAIDLLLPSDNNNSDDLLIFIYFKNHNWQKSIDILEPKIAKIKYDSSIIDDQAKDFIMKLAISYYMNNDKENIKDLYSDFKQKLQNDNILIDLEFLANNNDALDYKNLQKSLSIKETENFLENYKNSLK